jgi:cobalt-zinc-cadmium efflux system outer membrane protein
VLLFAMLLSTGPALAATDPTKTLALSWPDVRRLVEQHPRLAAGRLELDAARAETGVATAVPNPVLEGNVGQGFPRGDGTARWEWGVALTVPLGWLAQRGSRRDTAEAGIDLAEAEQKALRRDVLLQLRTLFWNQAYEQTRVASLEALESQTATLTQTVQRRVEQGEVRPIEATRVEIELEKVRSELESARTALEARQAELALWLGLDANRTVAVVADFDTLPVAMTRESALPKARANHPGRLIARARTRAFEAEVATERTARIPAFAVTGFATHELDRRGYGIGLAVDVPLWNWNSARIAQAATRVAASRKHADAANLTLDASVIDAQAACQASVATATRLRNNVVPRSEAAANTMEKTYQLGETTLLEVLDARRTLLDSRRLYLDALARAQIDCSRFAALVGEEPQ